MTSYRALGRQAFAAGLGPYPLADPAIAEAVAALPPAVGSGAAQIMREWASGWTAAHWAWCGRPQHGSCRNLTTAVDLEESGS